MTSIRFAIDTGGTFTDIVVLNEQTGEFLMDKAHTTPENTLKGVLAAIDKANVDLRCVSRFFVHGSTTALNAMLERKGVPTAYITTKGFRDVPEIMRYNRPEMYNPKYRKPRGIVPRELRLEITERIDAQGRVLVPLDAEEARRLANEVRTTEVGAVAICLLHSFRNPVHEQQLRDILREELPGLGVTISSAVAPEHREFERSMTTIMNAYLTPIVERWIGDLERELAQRGFKGEVVLTKSDGGGMSGEAAKRSPINMLLSGPAGGVIGALYMAQSTGHENLITMDVGGTSFDVALIKGGAATTQQQTSVCGFPILISNLDIRTIGAGGGSIGWIDSAKGLHVGPQSAAARPGPICYGRGGTKPTVTDAFLLTGFIDPLRFLGGEMELDEASARKGIEENIARPLGMSTLEAARGILRIVTANMAEAVKSATAETGDDPRDFKMLCFGGGGGIFGSFLIDELAIAAAIVPIVPAAFSAWGMLMVDLRHDVTKMVSCEASLVDSEFLQRELTELSLQGDELLRKEGVPKGNRTTLFFAEMRYAGQEHAVTVPLAFEYGGADCRDRLYAEFEASYRSTYGYSLGLPAELVTLRAKAVGTIPNPKVREIPGAKDQNPAKPRETRSVYDFLSGVWEECNVFDRQSLTAGSIIQGPALIEEPTTTTVVRRQQTCAVDRIGNLLISRRGV